MAGHHQRTKFQVGLQEPAYTQEELDFLRDVDRWQREKGVKFPTWVQILQLLKSLGYRKVAATDLRCWEGMEVDGTS